MRGFFLVNISQSSLVLIVLSAMLLAGFLISRITKILKLPNVTAYIFVGIFIGPIFKLIFKTDLIQPEVVKGMDFVTDMALAFIAFSIGRFFKLDVLKKSGKKMIVITLFESILASVFVFVAMYFIFNIQLELSLLLAAIASATAPASTMMTIRQKKAKGDFVNTILQVVSLDDAVSLILFSVSIAIITAVDAPNKFSFWIIAKPIIMNFVIVIIGIVIGIVLHFLVNKETRSRDNRLIITIAFLMVFSGVATIFDLSPLLGCMAIGTSYVNISKEETLFKEIDHFAPPILSLFFILSGMKLRLDMLQAIGLAGVVYFIVRIMGKYAGASLGSVVARSTENNKKYLGLALIPQAGVSLGLAALGSRILESYGLFDQAAILTTIIISSGVLYEIFGPPSAKLSLYLTHSYKRDDDKPRPRSLMRRKPKEEPTELQQENSPDN